MNRQEISSIAFNVQRSMETNSLLLDIGADLRNMFIVLMIIVCLVLIIMFMGFAICYSVCCAPRGRGDASSSAPSVMLARFPNLNLPSIANSREFDPDLASTTANVSEQLLRRRAREARDADTEREAAGGEAVLLLCVVLSGTKLTDILLNHTHFTFDRKDSRCSQYPQLAR